MFSICLHILHFFLLPVVAIALIWAVIWSITTNESLPGGSLFGFLFLYLFAVIGGKIMGLIKFPGLPPLPPLLGKYVFRQAVSFHI